MRDLEKKKRDDDLPANKPKPVPQEARKAGQEPADNGKTDMKSPAELEEMKIRLAASKDTQERKMILGTIQQRFGNEMAEKVVAELRLRKDGTDKMKEV
jgi:hypothetical protein